MTAALGGSVRAVARLISRVESGGRSAREVSTALAGRPREAAVWGLTGPPGVGKSTITAALIGQLRRSGRTVAVLAIDPSSPFSGGALLGDRVRMTEHVTDPGVFIRSMSSRGHLGGLSSATPGAVDLLSALGFDVVLVETVGVGQNEVDVLRLADTVVVVVAPGAGDGIQAAKAGILEIADLLVVNKGDREGAAATVRELKSMIALGRARTARRGDWRIPVLTTTATADIGIPELLVQIRAHSTFSAETGLRERRRSDRAAVAIETVVLDHVHRLLAGPNGRAELENGAARMAEQGDDAHSGAAVLWAWIAGQPFV
ncbi:methylmalonyl Co-A mutase-associated GTPase MeaB [Nakamurella panacisegetis]|uniref:methylmalonyl Co-A mutase-associated GTPase MeaB n=1 Tax=Nakamurella panacisegetis TaxID=1090615 RepID=UPI000B81408D|nr:methylmalonyl Co-A mutase-associated GTPase MeaB [Nakamurella panacisegetis]